MKCHYCGKEIAEGTLYCGHCGKKIPQKKYCIKCGKELSASAKWCGYCGANQEMQNDNTQNLTNSQPSIRQSTPTPVKQSNDASMKYLWITIACLSFVLICILSLWVFYPKEENVTALKDNTITETAVPSSDTLQSEINNQVHDISAPQTNQPHHEKPAMPEIETPARKEPADPIASNETSGHRSLNGYMEKGGTQWPIRMTFNQEGNKISNCTYYNIRYNVSKKMTGTVTSDGFIFRGTSHDMPFVITVSSDYNQGGWTGYTEVDGKNLSTHLE